MLVQECAQLTKANSIQGCKKASCGINYTWARNLKKTIGMEGCVITWGTEGDPALAKPADEAAAKEALKAKKAGAADDDKEKTGTDG